jgi:hypothetical protein
MSLPARTGGRRHFLLFARLALGEAAHNVAVSAEFDLPPPS